jgi:hypothetical protein
MRQKPRILPHESLLYTDFVRFDITSEADQMRLHLCQQRRIHSGSISIVANVTSKRSIGHALLQEQAIFASKRYIVTSVHRQNKTQISRGEAMPDIFRTYSCSLFITLSSCQSHSLALVDSSSPLTIIMFNAFPELAGIERRARTS